MARTPHLRYVRHRTYERFRQSHHRREWLEDRADALGVSPETIFNVLLRQMQMTSEQISALTEFPAPDGWPVNTVAPAISGAPAMGSSVTVSNGTWTGDATIAYAYQWFADGVLIVGANTNSLQLDSEQYDKLITARVTATNGVGSSYVTSTAVGPVEGIAPNISAVLVNGSPVVGQVLTASPVVSAYPTGTYEYQWLADAVEIEGATESTYICSADDVGKTLTCTLTVTNPAGTDQSTSSGVGPVTTE